VPRSSSRGLCGSRQADRYPHSTAPVQSVDTAAQCSPDANARGCGAGSISTMRPRPRHTARLQVHGRLRDRRLHDWWLVIGPRLEARVVKRLVAWYCRKWRVQGLYGGWILARHRLVIMRCPDGVTGDAPVEKGSSRWSAAVVRVGDGPRSSPGLPEGQLGARTGREQLPLELESRGSHLCSWFHQPQKRNREEVLPTGFDAMTVRGTR